MPRTASRTRDQLSTSPTYMTSLGARMADGRCRSSMDASVWLYGAVPLAQVLDAKDAGQQLAAMDPVFDVLSEITALSGNASTRRYVAKGTYREVHLLLINLPEFFHADWDQPQADYLNGAYNDQVVDRRLLLIGVKLKDQWGGGGGVRDIIDSTIAFVSDRQVPLGDYDGDWKKVKAAFSRVGVRPPTPAEFKLADAYWNSGRTPVTGTLAHLEHLHVFHAASGMAQAKDVGVTNCDLLEDIPTQSALTYAAVSDFDFDFDQPDGVRAPWISQLLSNGALVISIRGHLEPARVTAKELRRQRKRFVKDIAERQRQNKLSLSEQDEQLRLLEGVEAHYGTGRPAPTITDTSITVAFTGITSMDDLDDMVCELEPMTLTQVGAMAETWLCSSVRANPRRHDLPIQVLAASGLNNLSFVGDRNGALAGFTENDRQPAYIAPEAASTGDALPILVGFGSTGSGKTMNMLNLAVQWNNCGTPGVFVDPKYRSDHSGVFDKIGGQTIRLDDIVSADGILDPIRLIPGPAGIELAVSVLKSINPWGVSSEALDAPLLVAMKYGVEHGATCVGQALQYAERDRVPEDLPAGTVRKIIDTRDTAPLMAALIGLDPNGEALSVSTGATLIMVGDSNINLPHEGEPPKDLSQRVAVTAVRMMVFGASTALARHDRGGYVLLDEAWTFLQDPAEVVRLGRLARSQQVLPALFTQLPTDVVENKLSAFISRFLIGPLVGDREQAQAACTAARIDPDRYVDRLTADQYQSGTSHAQRTPNWGSMKALIDPDTREVLRGSVWLYKDLSGAVIPIECALPEEFIALASTNPLDIEARRREQEQQRGELADA